MYLRCRDSEEQNRDKAERKGEMERVPFNFLVLYPEIQVIPALDFYETPFYLIADSLFFLP